MFFTFSRLRVVRVPLIALVAWVALATTSGCTAHERLIRRNSSEAPGLSWFGPTTGAEQANLARWATAVGPPLVVEHQFAEREAVPSSAAALTLATWNVAVGEGDVATFVADVRRDHPERPIVLLLQEAYREGPDVPAALRTGSVCAGHLGNHHGGHGEDIGDVAARSGLNVYYVPSMRNGSPPDSREDRGNAILSSLPLEDLGAIELPFERQRRVAVAATVTGRSPNGTPWHMRLVSAHLDNMVGARRLWFAGGPTARARQARALVDYVQDDEIAVLGGDFNTWFGFAEAAFQQTSRAFPDTDVTDTRPTFHHLLRLDHLFFRLPRGWSASFERGRSQYGSDHWPLVATIVLERGS
jgi:endonuclease/exonuclease/phosphatase family metal-dependent hydrolase